MSILILDGLVKHFGAAQVLNGASFAIDPGERIGLVGANGTGKTTLLRIAEGEETPDFGTVTLRKGTRLGHVPQRPTFAPGQTVRTYVESGLAEARKTMERLGVVGEGMGSAEGEALDRLMREHDRLTERLEALGGWETERRVETVLSGIGLAEQFWDREAASLSGGERSRAALSRELVAGHELLLLDEPTNHLDLDGIEWIESWVKDLKGALLIVSHDRRLLENAMTGIVELERGKLVRYPGNYSRYLTLKAERYESMRRAFEIQRDKVRKEEVFIKKHMGSQRTAEAKGRLKRLRNLERLPQPFLDVRRPVIKAPAAEGGGELVLETEGLAAGFGERMLFEALDLRVGRGDRIGIVGPNGTGKSTLLRILAGIDAPRGGSVRLGHGAVCGFYDQDTGSLREDANLLEEVRRGYPQMTDLQARSHAARFLFRGEDVEKDVSALSGGERARLCLARLMLESPTWLALDEPTNHLDLPGRTALEEMLSEYQGALLCVSHDRSFLDALCSRILEVSAEGVRQFSGNYSEYRRQRDVEAAQLQEERREKQELERRAQQRRAAAQQARQPRKKRPNPHKLEKLEKRIMKLEERLAELRGSCAEERVYRNPQVLKETQITIAECERELEEAETEWASWG
ncbi:MAG: ABC-F family ATP-binding cassette domain-containing protein [Planctomycetota bacterium]|jgi:ATP-binding cassette subfamily F protein 3|nr:ABC transporter [Planctomycetota bacterium]MDP6518697.1 ABC-F family ATP-binding cassette domain-containing protein [Planctomycetota bacterium]MDP6956620.1 ABC-F family ATP-binding cassette domain-containing protein [Planctomycetota bacterium]